MKRRKDGGFTLVELLAVIVILAIILVIAVPGITGIIQSSTRGAFESDAKMVLTAISYKVLEDNSFDPTTINKANINTLLNIDDSNYKSVTISKRNDITSAIIVGQNKWANLTASGTSANMHVYEGLVLWLDASNPNSYPGTGTTWYDLSGNGNNVTLVNGPTYSAGAITFDGTDDYASFYAPNLSSIATVEMWCKIGGAYQDKMFFGWDKYDAFTGGGSLGYNTASSDVYGINQSTVSSLGIVNNWTHYVFEMRSDVPCINNKMYINGVSQNISQLSTTENPNSRNFNGGNGRIASWGQWGYYMPMSCTNFRVYNRALTTKEIQSNYNDMKIQLGL